MSEGVFGHVECDCMTELIRVEVTHDLMGNGQWLIFLRWFQGCPRRGGRSLRWRLRCAWRGWYDGELPAEFVLTPEKAKELIAILRAAGESEK